MYRILTERKNVDRKRMFLAVCRVDYTMFDCCGAWHGVAEDSLAIELANLPQEVCESVARLIKHMSNQQAILLQELPTIDTLL